MLFQKSFFEKKTQNFNKKYILLLIVVKCLVYYSEGKFRTAGFAFHDIMRSR